MATTRPGARPKIMVGGAEITTWTDVRVTRSLERFPSDFEFKASKGGFLPGMPVVITYGGETLLTGVIDRVLEQVTPESHDIHVSGRSRCRDLIDCSAEIVEWHGYKLKTDIKSLAVELCKPYGITVTDNTVGNPTFETFAASLGETPYEILERVARSVGVLVYDDPEGNLVLGRSLTEAEVKQDRPRVVNLGIGGNAQALTLARSGDGRYGKYTVVAQPVDTFSDRRAAAGGTGGGFIKGEATDAGSDPARHLYIVGEQWIGAQSLAQSRADWEANRRWGRSKSITAVMDGWVSRLIQIAEPPDSEGHRLVREADAPHALWRPNMPVTIKSFDIGLLETSAETVDWVISQVTYCVGAKGTFCEITAMPREAFLVEPVGIQRQDADRVQAADQARREQQGVQGPNQ